MRVEVAFLQQAGGHRRAASSLTAVNVIRSSSSMVFQLPSPARRKTDYVFQMEEVMNAFTTRTHTSDGKTGTNRSNLKRLDSIATALFFIWLGVALLVNIGWSWSLLGIGLIFLGHQLAVWLSGAKPDGFWIACGIALILGALWEFFGLQWPLAPVLLILLGAGSLLGVVFSSSTRD
jgi:hypothetical protein